jgi:hypothetical protein
VILGYQFIIQDDYVEAPEFLQVHYKSLRSKEARKKVGPDVLVAKI